MFQAIETFDITYRPTYFCSWQMSILNKLNKNPNKEMTFVDHLESLRWHIIRSVIALVVCAITMYWNIEWIFDKVILGPSEPSFPTYKALCQLGNYLHIPSLCLNEIKMNFQNTSQAGQFMLGMRTAAILGFVVASPYVFYEIWRFIKPGLSSFELRQSNGILVAVTFFFLLGIGFGYFILTPYTANFFSGYQLSAKITNDFKIDDYVGNVFSMTLGCGLVFQIPVIIYFLSKIGITTPENMKSTRKFAILGIFFAAAFISPPDVVSMFVVSIPLLLLYELSILICKRVAAQRRKAEIEFFRS
jgi:sec-independent protein translocase protein TatC